MIPPRPTIRVRLLLALVALAAATMVVSGTSWVMLRQATDRLDRLHDATLAAGDRALMLSRQASDLATLAPYLLTIESPYRLHEEAEAARGLIAGIADNLAPPEEAAMARVLGDMDGAIEDLVTEATARVALTDQILRRNTQIAALERRLATLAGALRTALPEGQNWLGLQRIAAALIGAGRSGNLVSVGEFQREYHQLIQRMEARHDPAGRDELARLRALAEGPEGLFELRRLELARSIAAEAAMTRIRHGAEAISLHAASVSAQAQSDIAQERARTVSAVAFAKGVIILVTLISIIVALAAALFVSGYVTANLRAVSEAMMRLAVGDRSTRLPRGEHAGDEIGKLFHAFRAFRARTLRLDRSNRQLAQRNALFENLYDGMTDGLAILSESGRLAAQNNRLAQVLDLPAAALEGRPRMEGLLAEAGWRRAEAVEGLSMLRHASGRVIELRENPLPTGGRIMLFSDISARRALEEKLQRVERTETLGKIAGEVAHDFGNILSTITTSLHLIEAAPPERQQALRQSLAAALDLGGSLTQRLLAFARRLNLAPEVMDLNALVEGVEDLIALALDERITLTIHPAPTPLMVRIDAGQMESALLNLCLNAGKAISGAGRIDIRLQRLSPEPGQSPMQDQAEICVIDTGCGMTPEVLAQAMEPFFTTRGDDAGTGLGLAMVDGFIRQSGGDIRITSSPGQGTTVRLILPLLPEMSVAPEPLPLMRVLLVEDDPQDAAHARRLLGAAQIVETASPAEAEALIASSPPFDLVLSDLHLQLDPAGWRIARAALARDPLSIAIVCSGRLPAENPLIDADPARGFALAKPLDPAALLACLKGLNL